VAYCPDAFNIFLFSWEESEQNQDLISTLKLRQFSKKRMKPYQESAQNVHLEYKSEWFF
jgi:hypothetical protein